MKKNTLMPLLVYILNGNINWKRIAKIFLVSTKLKKVFPICSDFFQTDLASLRLFEIVK